MLYKYVPDSAMLIKNGIIPVKTYKSYPPFKHPPKVPIKADCCLLELTLINGEKRYWGCKNAYINSELKMIAVFEDSLSCEIRLKWKDVPKERI